MESLTKACLSPVSKPHHINSIFTVNAPVLYIYIYTWHRLIQLVVILDSLPLQIWIQNVALFFFGHNGSLNGSFNHNHSSKFITSKFLVFILSSVSFNSSLRYLDCMKMQIYLKTNKKHSSCLKAYSLPYHVRWELLFYITCVLRV